MLDVLLNLLPTIIIGLVIVIFLFLKLDDEKLKLVMIFSLSIIFFSYLVYMLYSYVEYRYIIVGKSLILNILFNFILIGIIALLVIRPSFLNNRIVELALIFALIICRSLVWNFPVIETLMFENTIHNIYYYLNAFLSIVVLVSAIERFIINQRN